MQRLSVLDETELREIKQEGGCDLTCNFCNESYRMDPQDLDGVLAQLTSS